MGEMRGDPWGDPGALPAGSPGRLGYWEYGVPCGYMSGDLLLTSQVPKGNLETMINSAAAQRVHTPPWGDRLLRMASLFSVEWLSVMCGTDSPRRRRQ